MLFSSWTEIYAPFSETTKQIQSKQCMLYKKKRMQKKKKLNWEGKLSVGSITRMPYEYDEHKINLAFWD